MQFLRGARELPLAQEREREALTRGSTADHVVASDEWVALLPADTPLAPADLDALPADLIRALRAAYRESKGGLSAA